MIESIAETIRDKIIHKILTLHVWYFTHSLNLAVWNSCQTNVQVRDFFGMLSCLVTFIGSKKRTAIHLIYKKNSIQVVASNTFQIRDGTTMIV